MVNKTCLALHCTSSSKVNKELKFHHFPTEENKRSMWIKACKRIDLIDEDSNFFRSKYLCSLHFPKRMYSDNKNLRRLAYPILHLPSKSSLCSSTQTWESMRFFRPTPDLISDFPAMPDLKKIEIRTSHTQTEEFMLGADHNMEIKTESDSSYFQDDHIQYNEQKPEIKVDEVQKTTEENLYSENDYKNTNKIENFDETDMSVDDFIQYAGLESEIRKVLRKENVPQIPIEEPVEALDHKKANTEVKCKIIEMQAKKFERSIAHLYEMDVSKVSTVCPCHGQATLDKGTQTDDVVIYIVPKTKFYFQQCIRCGKREKVWNYGPPPESAHPLTMDEFLKACEKFLSPMFCTTVKNQIQLEELLKNNEKKESLLKESLHNKFKPKQKQK